MNHLSKTIILFILIFGTTGTTFALPKGSPDRCKKDDWAHIDDLVPPRTKDGGYAHLLDPAKLKISTISPDVLLQSVVDHLLTFYDLCGQKVAGVGGWEDLIGTNLCERLALYNITHNNILSGEETAKESKGELLFSDNDLIFVRSIYKACRPTTQRWWDYPLVVHVSFKPTPQEYARIGKTLKDLNSYAAPPS